MRSQSITLLSVSCVIRFISGAPRHQQLLLLVTIYMATMKSAGSHTYQDIKRQSRELHRIVIGNIYNDSILYIKTNRIIGSIKQVIPEHIIYLLVKQWFTILEVIQL